MMVVLVSSSTNVNANYSCSYLHFQIDSKELIVSSSKPGRCFLFWSSFPFLWVFLNFQCMELWKYLMYFNDSFSDWILWTSITHSIIVTLSAVISVPFVFMHDQLLKRNEIEICSNLVELIIRIFSWILRTCWSILKFFPLFISVA